jgi:hypothetical protein
MASTDARPIPRKNVAYRVTFPILDADGDLVTGATSPDSEISKDGGTFGDCTNEATEIATNSGMYYLDLTSTEMDADTVAIIVKSGSGKTTPIVLYPEEAGDLRVDVVQVSGDATAADNLEAAADGTGYNLGGGSVVAASVTGAVGSVTAMVTANATQISGDSTAADNLEAAYDGAGYAGGTIKQQVDAVALSGDTAAADNAEAFFDGTGYAGTNNVIPTVTTLTNKTGFSLSAAGIQAIWDALTSALTTANSIGKLLVDNINATIGSRATQTSVDTVDDFLDTEIAAIKAKTDLIPTDPAETSDIPSAATIADAVWDEAIAGHAAAGSTGEALGAAGSAGDPWTTALPGAYGAGSAGKLVGDNLNATVSSRASQASVDAVDDFLDTEVAAIKAKTDNLPADPADASDIAAAFAVTNGKIDAVDDFLDTEVAAIKAKTDNLPADPADASDIAAAFAVTNGKVDAVDDFLDTEMAAALAAVDTEVAAIKAKTDSLTFTGTDVHATLDGETVAVASLAANSITASALAADAVDEILDEAIGDSTITMRQALRVLLAGMAGKLSGAATSTITIRNVADSQDVVVATVTADGNRTAVTVTP